MAATTEARADTVGSSVSALTTGGSETLACTGRAPTPTPPLGLAMVFTPCASFGRGGVASPPNTYTPTAPSPATASNAHNLLLLPGCETPVLDQGTWVFAGAGSV